MNKFDSTFFKKYIPEGHEIISVLHIHPITILKNLFLKLSLLVFLPVFIFYNSMLIQAFTPFVFLEIYLFIIYINIIYDIFDWYNDVWIITNQGVVWLEWSLFKTNTDTLDYANIEGIGVEQNGILDKILKKGDLVIHKIGDDSFLLKDAINPYNAVNIIENISDSLDSLENMGDDRFDMIMDALGGVVGNYLDKDRNKEEKEKILEDRIRQIEKKKTTIDLR